jgi:hypothetical protein
MRATAPVQTGVGIDDMNVALPRRRNHVLRVERMQNRRP